MQPKILLVDDNITVIKIITSYLNMEGFSVYSTMDSLSVLNMAHEIMPDVILLDIIMPKLDGFEVCRLIKSDRLLNEIPVIILTAETDSKDLKVAMESGAMDYIRKPADPVELAARVRSAYRIKQSQDKLKELAFRDSLTGLYNHGALIERFVNEYERQAQMGENIAFIMIDIDFFKKINDTYGHLAGDKVLKEISCILSWSVDSNATVSRYGGEEFGIIITGMAAPDIKKLCETIRKSIQEYTFSLGGGHNTSITASLGFCAGVASHEIDCNVILKKADNALYAAKRDGRNRVVEAPAW